MFSMPGKINFVKKASIQVYPFDGLVMMLDGVEIEHDNGLAHFIDDNVLSKCILTFNMNVESVYIENLNVTHLVKDQCLKFEIPIYRWLIAQVDNK